MKSKTCGICLKEFPTMWKAKTKTEPQMCRTCALKSKGTPIGNYTMIKVSDVVKDLVKEQKLSTSKPRYPISSKSDKQKKIDAAYRVLRGQYMKDHPKCMFKYCQAHSEECHHIRGRGKEYMLDTREWMAVCKKHHDWIHANDKEARELGYLKSRLGK